MTNRGVWYSHMSLCASQHIKIHKYTHYISDVISSLDSQRHDIKRVNRHTFTNNKRETTWNDLWIHQIHVTGIYIYIYIYHLKKDVLHLIINNKQMNKNQTLPLYNIIFSQDSNEAEKCVPKKETVFNKRELNFISWNVRYDFTPVDQCYTTKLIKANSSLSFQTSLCRRTEQNVLIKVCVCVY